MVKYCAVANCRYGTHNRPDLSYFVFPGNNSKQLRAWQAFCRRGDAEFKTLVDPRICSLHFKPEDIKTSLTGRKSLVKGSVPSIFDLGRLNSEESSRSRRSSMRSAKKRESALNAVQDEPHSKISKPGDNMDNESEPTDTVDPIDLEMPLNYDFKVDIDHCYAETIHRPECDKDVEPRVVFPDNIQSTACQTDLTMEMIEKLDEQLKNTTSCCESLKKKFSDKKALKRELNIEDMLHDDESVRFYTNVPNLPTFALLVELISPYAEKMKYWDKKKTSKSFYQEAVHKKKPGRKRQLKVQEEFLLVLCRLRLGLLNRHLGQMFGVCETSVSKIVITWLCLLRHVFKDTLLRWPSKAEIQQSMPKSFKRYPTTRVIIDATEFFIEKPTSPSAQKATWSEYKHHNTMKLLVGIAPCGSFTFVSKLWSGSTSDRKITQESGLIELLEDGDNVMADRGFNVRDLLTRKGVELNMPPHSKGIYVFTI